MTFPMLADFAVRLGCGLAALLSLTSWRAVPLAFFRTHCLIILGLLVLAVLDAYRVGVRGPLLVALIVSGVLSYLAGVAWGLGVPRVARPTTWLITSVTVGIVCAVDPGLTTRISAGWAGAGRLASAFLMGSTLTAMLLGHHYLTAPAMSIEP
ncbi:MAG: hypothetical protein AB7I30_19370, partial [Isosphaeraceae bacterium]